MASTSQSMYVLWIRRRLLLMISLQPSRECDIVFSLMRKAIDLEYTICPLAILAVF